MKQKNWLTPTQRLLDGLSILICLGTVIYIAVVYPTLPQLIASHFDAAGNITGYQGKSMLIVLACLMVFLITLPMSVLVRVRSIYESINSPWPIPKGRERRVAELVKDFLCVSNLMMTTLFAYITLCCVHSWKPGIVLWLPIAGLTVALAVLLLKMRKLCKEPKELVPWETPH